MGVPHSESGEWGLHTPRDEFDIIMYPPLLPKTWEEPAKYPQESPFNLGRDSQVEDICDFIVEYIYSDVLVCDIFYMLIHMT